IRDKRFPLVCTRLYVRAGSATEDPAQAGISHVLEHMVFKGTSHRPKGQVAREVEEKGGYLNAATSFDKTWYITDMPAKYWKTGMDVVKDMAFQATLDAKELESEKEVVISELMRGEDSPMRKLFENLQTAALRNTPYGRPIIGFEESIRKLTVADLAAYVKKWYQPQNMMLLVAGDIEPHEALAYSQQLFGGLENRSDLGVPEPVNLANAASGSGQVEVARGPWSKVYLGIALPCPGLRDLRSVDLDVLAWLLGGDATSVFYKKYKYDRQLVDSISVSNMGMDRAGLFTITASLDAENVDKFWSALTADLGSLAASSFDAAAIERAKFNLEDSMDRASETLNGLASWRGTIQFDLGGEQAEENLRYAQRNVNKSELQGAIDNWLDSRQARVRVLAPQDAQLPDFEAALARAWPQAAQAASAEDTAMQGAPEVIQLDDGCKLVLLPDNNAPYIAIELLMAGGNAMLAPEQQGLANLTARMLTAGSGELNAPAMERWLAERAATLSAHAGIQTFGISLNGPARFNSEFFPMFRNVLFKPRFEAGEFTREINNMKAALKQRNDRPLSYMFAKVAPFLFPDQPYGYDGLGSEATLAALNQVSVRDFWQRQGGQPWALAISGSFNREEAIRFGQSLVAPHSIKYTVPAPHWGTARELELHLPGRNQAHLMRIFKTVPPTDPDAPALMLLQAAIAGQSGVLFTELRDKQGLGYTVTAFNRSMPEAGYLAFYIGTTADRIAQAQTGFDQVIEQLKGEALPAATLKLAANQLLGDYIRGRQSLAARASEAAVELALGRPLDFEKELIDRAARLTPEDVLAVARKYLVEPYTAILLP
ncbi:MAG: insulinase family protein, partial [Desulfovibrio sp.]|nr:insulinase family protein [Desulfovibrio sp.]